MRITNATAIVFVTGFLTVCAWALPTRGEECIVVESVPSGASLTVKRSFLASSVAPGTFCSLNLDTAYKLRVERTGFEGRSLVFSVSYQNRNFAFSGHTLENLARSAVLPGWGQLAAGGPTGAVGAILTGVAGAVVALDSYRDYVDARTDTTIS